MIHYKLKFWTNCVVVFISILLMSMPTVGMWEPGANAPAATKDEKKPNARPVETDNAPETNKGEKKTIQDEKISESPSIKANEKEKEALRTEEPSKKEESLNFYERLMKTKEESKKLKQEELKKHVLKLETKKIKVADLDNELAEFKHSELDKRLSVLNTYGPFVKRIKLYLHGDVITDSHVKYVLKRCPSLIELHLPDAAITDISLGNIGKNCPFLGHLDLSKCTEITDEGIMKILPRCTNLTYLNLSECPKLTDEGIIGILSSCTNLTYLNLSGCSKLTDSIITAIGAHCTALEELNLAGCTNMRREPILLRLVNLSNLKILRTPICKRVGSPRSLVGYYTSKKDIGSYLNTLKEKEEAKGESQILPKIIGLTKHASLRFSPLPSNSFMPDPRKPILESGPSSNMKAAFQPSQQLVELTPNTLDIPTIQWDLITKLSLKGDGQNTLNSQQELENHGQAIQDSHVEFIAAHCKPDHLTELHLCESEITDESLKLIGEQFLRLTHLNLSNCCNITDDGLIYLTGKCPRLTHLDVSNCKHVTNKGLEPLLEMCPELGYLNLSQCPNIGDKIINVIVTYCSNLKELNLAGCTNIKEAVTLRSLSWNLIKLETLYPPKGHEEIKRHSSLGSIEESRKDSATPEKTKSNIRAMSEPKIEKPTNRFLPNPSNRSQRRPQGMGSMRMSRKIGEISCDESDTTPNPLVTSEHTIPELKLNSGPPLKPILSSHKPSQSQSVNAARTSLSPRLVKVSPLDLSNKSNVITAVGSTIRRLQLYSEMIPINDSHFQIILNHCPNLTQIYLRETDITDSTLEGIAQHYPNLTHLDLSKCKLITEEGIKKIAQNCPDLTYLNISECSTLTSAIVTFISEKCTQLIELNLAGCTKIKENNYLLPLGNLSNLQRLWIPSYREIGDDLFGYYDSREEVKRYLNPLKEKRKKNRSFLQHFSMRDIQQPDKDTHELEKASEDLDSIHSSNPYTDQPQYMNSVATTIVEVSCSELHSTPNILTTSGDSITKLKLTPTSKPVIDSDVTCAIKNCPNLTELYLPEAEITNRSLEVIGEKCPHLTYLDLSKCRFITDEGLRVLSAGCPNLTVLYLSTARITDSSLETLRENYPMLTCLDLSECKSITEEGLKKIFTGCSKLTKLYLSAVQITDKGLEIIGKRCPYLTYLDLSNCKGITHRGLLSIVGNCTQLTYLNISGCTRVKSTITTAISKQCSQLIELNLAGCTKIKKENCLLPLVNLSNLQKLWIPSYRKIGGKHFGYYDSREEVEKYLGKVQANNN